jgi:hypothetical protein
VTFYLLALGAYRRVLQIMYLEKTRQAYRIAVPESSGKRSLGPKFRIFENYYKKRILGKRNKYVI